MPVIYKILFTYINFNLSTCFLIVTNIASSINYEAYKSYKILNSLMAFSVYTHRIHKQTLDSYSEYNLFLTNIKVNMSIVFTKNTIFGF